MKSRKDILKQNALHVTRSTLREKGFTLVELLVIIFIVSMISAVSIANFRQGDRQKQAVIAFDTVSNALRVAQNYTLSGRSTNNPSAACRTPQYYAVNFTYTNTMTITALNNNNAGCGSTPDVIETFRLPPNTRIRASGMLLNGIVANTNMVIQFRLPFAAVQASKDSGTYANFTTARITVESTDGSVSKVLTIDGVSGKVGE